MQLPDLPDPFELLILVYERGGEVIADESGVGRSLQLRRPIGAVGQAVADQGERETIREGERLRAALARDPQLSRRTSFPVFSPRNSIPRVAGKSSMPPSTTCSFTVIRPSPIQPASSAAASA